MNPIAMLAERNVLSVAGADRVSFLQGLVSNDVTLVAPGHCVWAALLNPQGKWLADFFIFADGDRLLIDCEAHGADDLARRLSRFRLRAKVTISPEPLLVHAAWGEPPRVAAIVAPDPRLPSAGWRILSSAALPTTATAEDYDRHRLSLGLPDGSRDMEADKSVLLEAGFDELNGVSWSKGCYMGQELTARTKYRGLVKRRLVPVSVEGAIPPPGAPIFAGGVEIGQMRSGAGSAGLALVRTGTINDILSCNGGALHVHIPQWLNLPLNV